MIRTSCGSAIAMLIVALLVPSRALWAAGEPSPVSFEKRVLADRYFCDGISAGDFNRDGNTDVVAGPYWYEGPSFERRHEFYPAVPLPPEVSPSNSMFSFVFDFSGDGWDDILVLGRVHKHEAYWYENPQERGGLWAKHFVFERVRGESPPFLDIDQDGKPELVCHWNGRWGWLAADWSRPTERWQFHPITEAGEFNEFYHGTGVGDVNGDGRLDLILNEGWWEQPAPEAAGETWKAHPFAFSKDRGGAQMFAYDVDGDGDNDVISSLNAHGWGLAWFEQVRNGDEITFTQHKIMGNREEEPEYGVAFTQPHALAVADLDGDRLLDIVTGKRRWAHGPAGDIEPGATPVVYWFQLQREAGQVRYVPHLIDDDSGVGVQIAATDVNGDSAPDVLTASKLGTFVFLNRRD